VKLKIVWVGKTKEASIRSLTEEDLLGRREIDTDTSVLGDIVAGLAARTS